MCMDWILYSLKYLELIAKVSLVLTVFMAAAGTVPL